MRIIGKFMVAAAVVAATLLTVPSAQADTSTCDAYLEEQGEENAVRIQICGSSEVLSVIVSPQAGLASCRPAMTATLLAPAHVERACRLAVEV